MKSVKVILAAFALLFATATASAQSAEDVANKYNAAVELINSGKIGEAIPMLTQVVDEGLDAGEDALETVQNAQKLLPTLYFRMGLAAAKTSNFDEALPNLKTAIELGELYGDDKTAINAGRLSSQIYNAKAATAFNEKDYVTAAEIFSQGYAANPNDSKLALNLAMSYGEMGELDKAFEVYQAIIALGEKHSKYAEDAAAAKDRAGYYVMLAAADAAQAKDNDKVFELIDKLLAIDPDNAQGQMLRLQTYTNMKNYDKVIEVGDITATAQTDAELKSDAYFYLGAAYQNKENKAKAIETYRKVTAGKNVATAKAQITALSK